MGRPDPCVLFAQTFVHPQLDEYVDEVIFAEPIVITACEFLEQSSSSASSAVTLVGATSPPSFAVEVFVQCEGETRFRRLCQPFLYSHSSSNVLEVEAVVTNHLVVRGSYRSLSLVVYGNTAEDLGQFSLEFDLDHSLANLVSSAEAKDDDLPSLLQERFQKIDDSVLSLKALPLLIPSSDLSEDIRKFMQLIFKIMDMPDLDDLLHVVIATVSSAAASFFTDGLLPSGVNSGRLSQDRQLNAEESQHIFIEAGESLLDHCNKLTAVRCMSDVSSLESIFAESVVDLATSRQLVEMLFLHFNINETIQCVRHPHLAQSKTLLFWLSSVLLLCSSRESCFHFVNGGGMRQLEWLFREGMHNSVAVTLMLLGVAEQATQFSVGCEGLLGWWPREDAAIPSSYSEGYSHLLKLLMQKQRHDVASLTMNILQHLRLYEVASRYEYSILTVLGGSSVARSTVHMVSEVGDIRFQLKKILKLLTSSSLVEDPSPAACASRSLILGQTDGVLSYKATGKLISLSSCCFLNWDIDPTLLSLLKERGFFPLCIALLSSSKFRADVGLYFDAFIDITSSIESITLLLLFCRSGLVFLLHHPELSSMIISALSVGDDLNKEVGIPLRYAFVLLSKGYFVRSQDVAVNVHIHMRVVKAIDCLVASDLQSEVLLGVLREFCALARNVCGRQALLTLAYIPEAVAVLIDALQSAKELETVSSHSGIPLNLAIFHSAAEVFEIIVTDPTSSSMVSWIDHAPGLYKALYSSSPGSNRKDSPTRLLEWIDAGVVYHKSGALGLLRYAAVLASGADAPLCSTNILVSDAMDVEIAEADSSNGPGINVVENLLGKLISEKSFEGFALRDSSVAQLTTALRILALISENLDVASVMYDEGANTVIYVILINCRLMLERSFNHYDYLVDEGSESNSTSDLLLERNREKCLVDLLIPTLMLLLELLQKLKEAKEQFRNTKLMNALLQLHRELSPKLVASAADLSSTFPEYAFALETVCHLIASALAYWPTLSWAPGLYHTLLEGMQASAVLALGPKEVCSMFCLLNDLLPEEDIRLWKADMPMLTALRSLALGSVLGPHKERQVNWYLQPVYMDVVISQLIPHLPKIAEIVLHYAVSNLSVIQDLIRAFIIRVASQRTDAASVLLQPIISWILDHIPEPFSPMEIDAYKVHKLIEFLSSLLEHPLSKPLLLKEGGLQMLIKVLQGSIAACEKQVSDTGGSLKSGFNFLCFLPTLKSLTLICDSRSTEKNNGTYYRHGSLSAEDSSLIFRHLFKLWQMLPVERELVASLQVFKELVFQSEGRQGLQEIIQYVKSCGFRETQWESEHECNGSTVRFGDNVWNKHPLLCCWITLYKTIEKDGLLNYAIEALHALCLGALKFCFDGKSLNEERVAALKYSFGISEDPSGANSCLSENIKYIEEMPALLGSNRDENLTKSYVHQVSEFSRLLLLLVQPQTELVKAEDSISKIFPRFSTKAPLSSKIPIIRNGISGKSDVDSYYRELLEKFQWECPENLRSRLSQGPPGKRKLASSDGPNRLGRGENSPSEAQSSYSRGSAPSSTPLSTRRDSFRQRKPNTSRPPSMHVDDYVARERNADGSSNSNVIAIPRLGSSSGRPPSVHVDEFMARQRERHNAVPVPMAGVEAAGGSQGKAVLSSSEDGAENNNKPKTLKVDLDDDLQGIDIVFDGEELEPDDKLPFPQPDDIVQKDGSGAGEPSPQRSIVEETDSDVNNTGATVAPLADENSQNELSSRVSASRREMSLTREPSITSERKYPDQSDEKRSSNLGMTNDAPAALPIQVQGESRRPPHNFYPQNMQQIGNVTVIKPGGLQRDPKLLPSQPPLPRTPPLLSISPVRSHVPESQSSTFMGSTSDVQPLAPSYHVPSEYPGAYSNMTSPLVSSHPKVDSRYPWPSHSSPAGPSRHLPPLPPNPPPFQASQFSMPLRTSSSSQLPFNSQTGGIPSSEHMQPSFAYGSDATRSGNLQNSGSRLSYHQPMPSGMLGRPTSMQQYDNLPSISPSMATSQLPFQPGLQPLQPPAQIPFQPQLPQRQRPAPVQGFQQVDQGGGLQVPGQMPTQPQQVLQQSQVPPQSPMYYQQPDNYLGRPLNQLQQVQPHHQQPDGSQDAQDSNMSLQQYFSSPEAIQSLLSDRDKLCQLLEQHPKLMQMLQERLGQL